jgi:RNA-binding protein YlmH
MRNELYQHFHPDEKPFIDKSDEWLMKAAWEHQVKRTDFLDPRQAFILSSLANRYDGVQVVYDGGYPEAERKRALIMPDYRDPEAEDAGVSLLAITSEDSRFSELDHGDFLGAILGLGIKRDKVGDLHPGEAACHCLVASEIADYIRLNLRQVHRAHVYTDLLPLDRLKTVRTELDEMTFTVASMRLDAILGDVYKLSRAKASAQVQAGHCKLNWKVEENPSRELREGDIVSLKGYGRFKILEAQGVTKSGRIRVRAGRYR